VVDGGPLLLSHESRLHNTLVTTAQFKKQRLHLTKRVLARVFARIERSPAQRASSESIVEETTRCIAMCMNRR
jgi:hypothetical protein